MSNFEFVFSLLVILLGLGLGEVFGGLARVVKARPRVRSGLATGLLATWTITRTVLFWRVIWRTRDTLPDNSASLLAGRRDWMDWHSRRTAESDPIRFAAQDSALWVLGSVPPPQIVLTRRMRHV
jgi:hypothetical protein